MDTITITPFKEGMDMEKTKRELDIHADGYRQGYKAAIEKAKMWLLNNGIVDMDSSDIDIHFKSGYMIDFLKAMEE